jgi:hypothetical protein
MAVFCFSYTQSLSKTLGVPPPFGCGLKAAVRNIRASSLSGFALHAAKQTADAVWLENEHYKETSER